MAEKAVISKEKARAIAMMMLANYQGGVAKVFLLDKPGEGFDLALLIEVERARFYQFEVKCLDDNFNFLGGLNGLPFGFPKDWSLIVSKFLEVDEEASLKIYGILGGALKMVAYVLPSDWEEDKEIVADIERERPNISESAKALIHEREGEPVAVEKIGGEAKVSPGAQEPFDQIVQIAIGRGLQLNDTIIIDLSEAAEGFSVDGLLSQDIFVLTRGDLGRLKKHWIGTGAGVTMGSSDLDKSDLTADPDSLDDCLEEILFGKGGSKNGV